jgi:hypothetical protein
MVIPKTVELNVSDIQAFHTCKVCNQNKYLYTSGFFPGPIETDFDIAHTKQYFGTGKSAFRVVLISKDMYRMFIEFGVKGVAYIPCCSNGEVLNY